jgi:hypothetical protein
MHLAIVDCTTTHPTRHLHPSFYTDPLPEKKSVCHYDYDLCYEEEIRNDHDRTAFYRFVENNFGLKEDMCLGRFDIPKDIGKPFYVNEETQEIFADYNPRVLTKKDFEWIIGLFKNLVIEQYKEILLDPNKSLRWQGHIEAKLDRWQSPYAEPYNMDEEQKSIVRAYDLEYRIFDLVRMYKSIDWARDTVIFYGW